MGKVSVILITGNEEKNIKDCLETVSWADEIVVVDSESTDKTVEIAKKYTDKVIINKWPGFAKQKQFALDNATNDWVLTLDADERITPELKDEILAGDFADFDGFLIKRRNFFLGKEITTCGWEDDFQIRLFKRLKTKVTDREVHEGFCVDGKTGYLKHGILHFTHVSLDETLPKINHYSTLQAREFAGKKKTGGIAILLHSLSGFLRFFISRKGYKDGMRGFLISMLNSFTSLQTYMKLWENELKQKQGKS